MNATHSTQVIAPIVLSSDGFGHSRSCLPGPGITLGDAISYVSAFYMGCEPRPQGLKVLHAELVGATFTDPVGTVARVLIAHSDGQRDMWDVWVEGGLLYGEF